MSSSLQNYLLHNEVIFGAGFVRQELLCCCALLQHVFGVDISGLSNEEFTSTLAELNKQHTLLVQWISRDACNTHVDKTGEEICSKSLIKHAEHSVTARTIPTPLPRVCSLGTKRVFV